MKETQVVAVFGASFQGSTFLKRADVPASALVFLSRLYESQYTHAITQKYFVNRHIQSTPRGHRRAMRERPMFLRGRFSVKNNGP